MDILDQIAEVPSEPVQLEAVAPQTQLNPVPLATLRNRSASAVLLSGEPENVVERYQATLAQSESGDQSPVENSFSNFFKQDNTRDMRAIMNVLSDPSISVDQKRRAMNALRTDPVLKDSGTALLTRALEAASDNETFEAEDARISTADALREMYEARDRVQALVNAHGATLSDLDTGVALNFLEAVLAPFGAGVSSYKIAKSKAEAEGRKLSVWDSIKALTFQAGTTVLDMRKQLASIPPEGQVEYTNKILGIIKNNSGILFTNDNQFNQFQKAQAVFAENGYDSVDAFIDNASFLLDIIGIGQVLREVSKGRQATKVAAAGKAGTVATETRPNLPPVEVSKVSPPMTGKNDAQIAKLQEEVAGLIGEAGNLAGKGDIRTLRQERKELVAPDVTDAGRKARAKEIQADSGKSYKASLTQANKELDDAFAAYQDSVKRIDDQIAANAKAATVGQRIDNLQKQIAELNKGNTPVLAPLNPIVDAIRRIDVNSVVRIENPASVANIIQQANPAQARRLHEAVFKSVDDAVAEGLYGVNKAQALINDVYPQAKTASRAVAAKPVDIQRGLRLDPELASEIQSMLRTSDVAMHYSKDEMIRARSNIVKDFSDSTDLVPNDAMGSFESGFKIDGSNIEISAVYGTKEGAFSNAQQAVDQAKYALRNYGIRDDEIEVLSKQGLDYVPVNLADVAGKEGSYLVRINTRHEVDPTTIGRFDDKDTVRLNFFDRIPFAVWNRTGSVSRHLADAASMLPKRLSGSAVVATDITSKFEKQMLDIATRFSDGYVKLPKARKAKVDDYIKEANFKEIAYDRADLMARGFTDTEADVLKYWRDFWDVHYVLENQDVVRTLNAQGFQLFKNGQTELYARPIAKNRQLGKIYDPSTGMVVTLSADTIDDLYNQGGTIAKLRRPTEFSFGMPSKSGVSTVTDTTEYMIVRNTPTEYLRKFRDTDEVLNYRNGYYQIQYKAPRFIDEISYDTNGKEVMRKAIAVAGDTKEAQHFAERQKRLNPDKAYDVRGDDKAVSRGSDDWFDLNTVRGRIAQKHRGKFLEEASGLNHLGDGSYIANPVESAIRAAKSISGRTVNRPMLESAKARFIQQYGDVLQSNGMGNKVFPSEVSQIGAKGKQFDTHVADARTTWEYIHYLENGYINTIDEMVKAGLNSLSTKMGELGASKAERVTGALADMPQGPTGIAKNFVFQAYIGTNILRNWLVQTNQIVRTLAYNPQVWLTGKMPVLTGGYLGNIGGTLSNVSNEIRQFTRFVDESGLLTAVDKQNLVRGSLLAAAESTSRAGRIVKGGLELPRKAGFDVGESINLLGHAAAVFDKYKRAGKNMDDVTVLREAQSEVRAISYDMNFAGDMPYNQTAAAALLQFMQIPHKAFLQATNRRIPADLRARMVVADMVMWGAPVALISSVMSGDITPEDPKLHEIVTDGLQSFVLNQFWSDMLGETVQIDYSSLAPYSMDGWAKFFKAMFSGGIEQMLINSPSGQMFFADGGRIQSAISQTAKFFSPWTPGTRTNEEAIAVVNEIAKIASGWNNAMKSRQVLEQGRLMDKYGNTIDPNVNKLEAIMQLFGFGTQTANDLYKTQMLAAEGTKKYEEEVKQVYKEIKQYYQNAFQQGITDSKQLQMVTGHILYAYKDSTIAMDIIRTELNKDLSGKDNQLMRMMMKWVDLPEFGATVDQIRNAPISDEQKEMYIKRLEDARNARSAIIKE